VSQNLDEWQTIGDLATAYSLAANGIGISYMVFAWLRQLLQGTLSIFTKLPYFQDEQARRYFLGIEIAANCCKLPLLILDSVLIFKFPAEVQNASGGIIYFAASIKLVGLVTNVFSSGKKLRMIFCPSSVEACGTTPQDAMEGTHVPQATQVRSENQSEMSPHSEEAAVETEASVERETGVDVAE
jgi:hypothetical protein